MKLRTVWLALILALTAPSAGSAAPPDPAKEALAERIHRKALTAIRANKLAEAALLWEEAESLSENWKYSFNLTLCRVQQQEWVRGWQAVQRTERRGVPKKHRSKVTRTRQQIRTELMKKHAWLELAVSPKNARVTLDGKRWKPPYERWVSDPSSVVVVEAPGYHTQERAVRHPAGAVYRERFELKKRSIPGRLRVRGTPAGATVWVGGKMRGTLPEVTAGDLPAGEHPLEVRMDGKTAHRQTVVVKAGKEVLVQLALSPGTAVPDPTPRVARPPNNLGIWGWTSVGVGVVAAGAGAGMFVWRGSIVEEVGTVREDDPRLSELESDFNLAQGLAVGLTAVGGTAIVTGVVLLLLDDPGEPGTDTTSGVRVVPWATPMGIGAAGTF